MCTVPLTCHMALKEFVTKWKSLTTSLSGTVHNHLPACWPTRGNHLLQIQRMLNQRLRKLKSAAPQIYCPLLMHQTGKCRRYNYMYQYPIHDWLQQCTCDHQPEKLQYLILHLLEIQYLQINK